MAFDQVTQNKHSKNFLGNQKHSTKSETDTDTESNVLPVRRTVSDNDRPNSGRTSRLLTRGVEFSESVEETNQQKRSLCRTPTPYWPRDNVADHGVSSGCDDTTTLDHDKPAYGSSDDILKHTTLTVAKSSPGYLPSQNEITKL